MNELKLYTYYRSSAAFRVRIALNLKGLTYKSIPINLVNNGGEQNSDDFRQKNPQGLVPLLQTEDDQNINQSLVIIEYLEEAYPDKPLLPRRPEHKALVRSIAHSIACDIHPLNNLRVLNYLKNKLAVSDEDKSQWYQHWVRIGFAALEEQLRGSNYVGDFCYGDRPSMADCCLVPQVYNAQRFKVGLESYPVIARINENCLSLEEFKQAEPVKQQDAKLNSHNTKN